MITLLFFLFYLTAANKLEPLLYQNESDFFVADFGRSLTVSGDNRDKIAQMLYFRLQGHDSDLPFYLVQKSENEIQSLFFKHLSLLNQHFDVISIS